MIKNFFSRFGKKIVADVKSPEGKDMVNGISQTFLPPGLNMLPGLILGILNDAEVAHPEPKSGPAKKSWALERLIPLLTTVLTLRGLNNPEVAAVLKDLPQAIDYLVWEINFYKRVVAVIHPPTEV